MSTAVQTSNAWLGAAAVALGAALGALGRWQLSAWLNPLHGGIPLGTLASNLIGGYLVGVAVAWFAQQPDISLAWRLFAITGFLGGLTTFSTFSAEVVGFLQQGRVGLAMMTSGLHLLGSLLATWIGWWSVTALSRSTTA